MFSCKGSAFLWAKQEVQNILSPLVTVQWDADFINNFLRQGTRDETAFICAGVAVNFYQHIGFERLRKRNSEMVIKMALTLAKMWNTEILAPKSSKFVFVSIYLSTISSYQNTHKNRITNSTFVYTYRWIPRFFYGMYTFTNNRFKLHWFK